MFGPAIFAAAATVAASQAPERPPLVCYDVAVVATMAEIANQQPLPVGYLGFRADFLLEVEQTLSGQPPGPRFWATGVLTDAFTTDSRLAIFLQKGGDAQAGRTLREDAVGLIVPARSAEGYRIVEINTDPRKRASRFPHC